MSPEPDELRTRLDELAAELAGAQARIEELQRQKAPWRPNRKLVAGIVAGLLALISLGVYAQVGPTPLITTEGGLLLNLTRRVTALEREVAALKANRPGDAVTQRVRAPFEVVDRSGTPIFKVQEGPRRVVAYHANGQPGVQMYTEDPASGGLAVYNTRNEVAQIGPMPSGQLGLRFGVGDAINAAFGLDRYGKGLVVLADAAGSMRLQAALDENDAGRLQIWAQDGPARAAMKVNDGRGVVAVYNQAGTPIAYLFESPDVAGSGRLYVTDAAGNAAFRAGWTPDNLGSACVDRKNGVWCVGINIPLGIGAGAAGGR